jgi:YHS domain-containing protein
MDPDSNSIYARPFISTHEHPVCVVCGMDADRQSALKSLFGGRVFHFCTETHRKAFDAAPGSFVAASD